MSERERQKAETRQRLLEAAARLFAEGGFSGTRTADVAAAVGVSHGTVFAHFPTRDSLVMAVAQDFGRRLTDRLHALERGGGTLRDPLAAHVTCLAADEALYTRLLVERPHLPADLQRGWTAIQSAVSHHLLAAAEPEERAGRLKKMPPHLLFNTWIGLVHHYLMNRDVFAPRGGVLKKHGPALVDHYMTLVTSRKKVSK